MHITPKRSMWLAAVSFSALSKTRWSTARTQCNEQSTSCVAKLHREVRIWRTVMNQKCCWENQTRRIQCEWGYCNSWARCYHTSYALFFLRNPGGGHDTLVTLFRTEKCQCTCVSQQIPRLPQNIRRYNVDYYFYVRYRTFKKRYSMACIVAEFLGRITFANLGNAVANRRAYPVDSELRTIW